MRLIIGLGNPGKEYETTRHNAGFLALEYLRAAWNFPTFRTKSSFQAECSEGTLDNEKILLVRPLAFMNRSGESVQKMLHFYKMEPDDIAVIHDDLDIPRGEIRVSFDSRSAGHRGVESIIESVGTRAFLRLRIGIGAEKDGSEAPNASQDTVDFVLDKFSEGERALLESLFPNIASRLRAWMQEKKKAASRHAM